MSNENATELGALMGLQKRIGEGNASRGFHQEGDELRERAESASPNAADAQSALRNYYMAKMGLIVTEAAEGIEELRHGRGGAETYYSGGADFLKESESLDENGNLRKLEGVPSELADIVIRSFDLADEMGFNLGLIIQRKLAYNGTRGFMHNGKVI